jgi:glycerol-3-phosphate acyltransferase PlsY
MFTNLKFDLLTFNLIFFSYIIGSISNAILLSNCLKLPDPRTMGSNNPGTTNMLRIGGKKVAAIVFILDLAKGLIPVYLTKWLNMQDLVIAAVAIAVFIGHLFPIFFKFQGGKGVATTLGIMLAICWPLALWVLIAWILVFMLFRISSLAALSATCVAIILCSCNLWLINKPFEISQELSNCIIILSILITLKHKENIKKLLNNAENLFM